MTWIASLCAALAVTAQPIAPAVAGGRVSVPGGHLVYDAAGAGPPVVLLHGAFMDRQSWDRQWEALAARFRVVRYDIRPFGASSTPDQPYRPPDDLLRLLDELRIDCAHLVGHSFGGSVALDFALTHPERVASLVLVAAPPGGFVGPDDERRAAGAVFAAVKQGDEAIVQAWLAHPIWSVARTRPEVRRVLEAMTRRNLAPFRLPFAPYVPMTPPAVERLGEVQVPALVVVGDRDTPGNRQAAELLASRLPRASRRIVAGADHALPLGWAGELTEAVIGFISSARR